MFERFIGFARLPWSSSQWVTSRQRVSANNKNDRRVSRLGRDRTPRQPEVPPPQAPSSVDWILAICSIFSSLRRHSHLLRPLRTSSGSGAAIRFRCSAVPSVHIMDPVEHERLHTSKYPWEKGFANDANLEHPRTWLNPPAL